MAWSQFIDVSKKIPGRYDVVMFRVCSELRDTEACQYVDSKTGVYTS